MVQEILAFFKIPWIAAFTAVFFWWFLTGLILFIVKKVDEINQRAHKFVTLIFSCFEARFKILIRKLSQYSLYNHDVLTINALDLELKICSSAKSLEYP